VIMKPVKNHPLRQAFLAAVMFCVWLAKARSPRLRNPVAS